MIEFNFYDNYTNVKDINLLAIKVENFIIYMEKILLDYIDNIYYINNKKILKYIII